jgi:hypothetical protein
MMSKFLLQVLILYRPGRISGQGRSWKDLLDERSPDCDRYLYAEVAFLLKMKICNLDRWDATTMWGLSMNVGRPAVGMDLQRVGRQ